MNDLQFALRQLRKSPAFSLLAVLTLAVGIGMNTAIFSLVDNIFLHGLPFDQSDRIVHVYGEAKERDLKQLPFSVPKFLHFRDATKEIFSDVAADGGTGYVLTGIGDPIQVLGANVTSNYFDLLGIRPLQGRNFLPQEEMQGRRRPGHAQLLEEQAELRSDGAWANADPQWRAHDNCRRFTRSADFLVRPRRRIFHG